MLRFHAEKILLNILANISPTTFIIVFIKNFLKYFKLVYNIIKRKANQLKKNTF
jgi:hypothetical protein